MAIASFLLRKEFDTNTETCTSKGIGINPSKPPSLYKISRCYFCCFMEWTPWFNTLPDSIFSRRLILHSFSKLSSVRPELWLSKQTLDYGGHSDCAEMRLPRVLCLRLLPGQWPSQLGVTHTLSSKVRASLLHPYSILVIKERAPTPMKMMDVSLCANKWNLTAPCPGEIAEITLQALTEPCIL